MRCWSRSLPGWFAISGAAVLGGVLLVPSLRALLPAGTFLARPGLPAGLAARAALAFSYFGTEAFVPLGATVLRGTQGFGANSVVHKARLLEMSSDLPIVIEVVDTEPKVRSLLPHLEAMVTEGMITMEYVTILMYRHDPADAPGTT